MGSFFKLGIIFMLLVLFIGPMLQIYDCFNDAPNVDCDALLHTVDALLSIAIILGLSCVLLWTLAVSRFFADLLEVSRPYSSTPVCDIRIPASPPQMLSLRI